MIGLLVLLGLAGLTVLVGVALTHDRDRAERLRHRFRDPLADLARSALDRFGTRTGLTVWLGGAIVALLAITWLAGLGVLVFAEDAATPVDQALTDLFLRGRVPWLSVTWNVITFLGDSSLLLPAAIVGGLVWRRLRGDWFAMALLVGSYSGAALLFNTAKRLVGRARPGAEIAFNQETGMAFPSGHTTDTAAVYTAVALLLATVVVSWAWRRAIAISAGTIIVLVAASRLYLGAHWFTDVVWGAILGTVWAGVLWVGLTVRSGPFPREDQLGRASGRDRPRSLTA